MARRPRDPDSLPVVAPAPPPVPAPTTGLGRFADALVELAPVAALAIVPLYFNPLTERVFEPDKLAWSIVLACMAAWGLVVGAAERQRDGSSRRRRIGPLGASVALVAVTLALATVASVVPTVSVWGAYRRGQGIIAIAAFLIHFGCVAATAGRPAARARLRRTILVGAIPAALYALFQRFGIDSLEWNIYGTSPSERAFGPLGNPIFLGAYLLMVVPLALAAAIEGWEARRKGAPRAGAHAAGAALVAALSVAGLLASQSRGPLIGLAVAIGLFAVLLAAATGRRRAALAMVALAAAATAALAAAGTSGVGASLGLGRLGEIVSMGSRTAQQRLLVWDGLGQLFRADPLRAVIGFGPETTAYILPAYLPDALVRLAPVQIFDRAHNGVWEWWVSAGLIGVAVMTMLYAIAFATGLRRLGLAGPGAAGAAIGGAAIGAVLPMLAGRPTLAALGLPFGLLAAVALYTVRAARERRVERSRAAIDRRRDRDVGAPPGPGTDGLWVIAVLAALGGHLAEGALGLPTAAGELLFWTYVGLLAAPAVDRAGDRWRYASLGGPEIATPAQAGAGPRLRSPEPAIDGWAEGLALGAVLLAPILLPSPLQTWRAWPILLLVPLGWLGADTLGAGGGRTARARPAARLAMLLGLLGCFVVLQGFDGGEIVAFGLVLVVSTLAAALWLARARPADAASQTWRWTPYAALALFLALGAWWAGIRPEIADHHIRAGQEAAVASDWDAALAHYTRAGALWPQQSDYAVYRVGELRRRMLDAARPEQDRLIAFEQARSDLERAYRASPDAHVATRLGVLYRDRGDLAAASGDAAQWWRKADGYLGQALVLQPNSPNSLHELGGLLERTARWQDARGAYARAFDLNAGAYDAAAGAMRASLALADVAAAETTLDAAIRRDAAAMRQELDRGVAAPLDPLRADQARVMLLARTDQLDAARDLLEDVTARAADDPTTRALEAWLGRGESSPR